MNLPDPNKVYFFLQKIVIQIKKAKNSHKHCFCLKLFSFKGLFQFH